MLIRITAPHFVAGYDLDTNSIAPIIKYMKDWSCDKIQDYCYKKNWEVQYIGETMEIQIEIINVDVVNKGKYKVAEVTYKDGGKTNTKKVMSFGAQEQAFKALASDSVKKGNTYTVEINKNADGYWDWVKVGAGEGGTEGKVLSSKGTPAPGRGNYETPEERFARQVYIVRQSSLTAAISYLNHTKKNYDVAEIIGLAGQFEEFVFGKSIARQSADKRGSVDTGGITEMDDDIPF